MPHQAPVKNQSTSFRQPAGNGHLRVLVGNILLSASGPLTICSIKAALAADYPFTSPHTIKAAIREMACDNYRILTVCPVRVGARKIPALAYQLTQK